MCYYVLNSQYPSKVHANKQFNTENWTLGVPVFYVRLIQHNCFPIYHNSVLTELISKPTAK